MTTPLIENSEFSGVLVEDGRVGAPFWAFVASWLLLRQRDDQELLANRVEIQAARLFSLLDRDDLAGTEPAWLDAVFDVVERGYADSRSVMVDFVNDYGYVRSAQAGDIDSWDHLGTVSDFRAAEAGSVIVSDSGMDVEMAAAQLRGALAPLRNGGNSSTALSNSLGAASQEALQGGRDVAKDFAAHSRLLVGWQRITDTDPCAFCALLAARGPYYKNVKKILVTDAKFADVADVKHDNDARVHYHCRCSIVPVYKDEPEPLSGWSRVAQELWEAGGHKGDNAKEHFRSFRRRYDRYKKTHPDEGVEVDERVLRRQIEAALFDTSNSKERELLRSLRRRMR